MAMDASLVTVKGLWYKFEIEFKIGIFSYNIFKVLNTRENN